MMKTFLRTAGVLVVYMIASAHVGSPDTWFEGNAGPYHVTVQIETAGVVPGIAKVFVRATGDIPQQVTIQANKFDATGGAPPPEPAIAGDDAGLFSGKLWIMSSGSNSVTVAVSGAKGAGKVVVPVVVVAYSRLKLDKPMGAVLAGMGIFLFAGLVTIVGAAVRESVLQPGDAPSATTRRRARVAMSMTSVLLAVAILGGWRWWNSEDASYVRRIYKPLSAVASIDRSTHNPELKLSITDSSWVHRGDSSWLRKNNGTGWTPLVEDHGKLIHIFMIRNDNAAFAHLHSATSDSVHFPTSLPPLPAGDYRVFADVVHESGFTHTMVTSVKVPERANGQAFTSSDPDDSYFTGAPARAKSRAILDDGSTIDWLGQDSPIVAGKPADLRFEVRRANGSLAALEPYMGMAGHAVVERADGSVFVHLHPMGTISMASQMAFAMRQPGDTIKGQLGKRVSEAEMSQMRQMATASGLVSFPYAFPREGSYLVWVQVRFAGSVHTAAFVASVRSAPAP
ncbi:MAG: hypothetical protein ABIQ55_07555 [Gemmatimonadaceae bacterium]